NQASAAVQADRADQGGPGRGAPRGFAGDADRVPRAVPAAGAQDPDGPERSEERSRGGAAGCRGGEDGGGGERRAQHLVAGGDGARVLQDDAGDG
ncbi:unnamed protein product, partial [Ectocarpus fasciculatus]